MMKSYFVFLAIIVLTIIVIMKYFGKKEDPMKEQIDDDYAVQDGREIKYSDVGSVIFQGEAAFAVAIAVYEVDQISRCEHLRILKAINPEINVLSYANENQKKFIDYVLAKRSDLSLDNLLDDDIEFFLEELRAEYGWHEDVVIANLIYDHHSEEENTLILFNLIKDNRFYLIEGSMTNDPFYPLGEYNFRTIIDYPINEVKMSELMRIHEDWPPN